MGIKLITQPEIDIYNDNVKTSEADIELMFDSTLKAFALVVLDEINLLRVDAGLSPRTITQLKNAVKEKLI